MALTISSLADTSSILYEGRAKISDLEDIAAMADEAWRKRLEDALKNSNRSKREISLKAGKGAGYVHSILSEGKDPTIESLIAVCQELGVSLTWIVYGFEISPATEQLLSLIEQNPDDRAAVLQILQKREKA
ncbi:helix-turn-helix domain-containing protein [Rhizobium leguminosarum]|uniref:helix-turn-helix domain-containing protein n=2 Tax=Rhizobium/Agrobacterium group TaxID=227290 RepID=UPI0032B30276